MIEKLNIFLDKIGEAIVSMDRRVLIYRLSVILFLIYGGSDWTLDIPLQIVCILMLLNEKLLLNRGLWIFITASFVLLNLNQWYAIDNHKYLITYWCIVCCVALFMQDKLRFLKINARWLIGLVFLYAVVWKLISDDFMSGEFMEFTMLTDSRMLLPSIFAGGMDVNDLYLNYELLGYMMNHPDQNLEAFLAHKANITEVSVYWSYATVIIEVLLAVLFLAANLRIFRHLKDYILMLFVLSTYFLLPVTAFGITLVILGIAQCETAETRKLLRYLVCLLILQFTLLPLEDIFLRWV